MTLPKVTTPTFKIKLPTSGKEIKLRPFLVKEEKIIMLAVQAGGPDDILNAIKDVIRNCTFDDIDVDTLSTIDIEYIFLRLRIMSRGSLVNLQFKCNHVIKEKQPDGREIDTECGHITKLDFDLETVEVKVPDEYNTTIVLDKKQNIGVVMKPPTYSSFYKLRDLVDETKSIADRYDIFLDFIDYVFDGTTIYKDFTREELKDFIESLSNENYAKIKNFFNTLPKLSAKLHICCSKCKNQSDITLEGLQNFLD